jgi:hypothetical protein
MLQNILQCTDKLHAENYPPQNINSDDARDEKIKEWKLK